MLMCGSVAVGASERPVLLAGHAIVMTIKLAEITIWKAIVITKEKERLRKSVGI